MILTFVIGRQMESIQMASVSLGDANCFASLVVASDNRYPMRVSRPLYIILQVIIVKMIAFVLLPSHMSFYSFYFELHLVDDVIYSHCSD